ncbi:hypothetical protein [Rurimicrobium arvi]|uniref:Phosphoribosylpyrophosphate synthetase n=1 Tax=Rurimicrobium arvi TaxID=2049916 RepID=A0ABP8MTC4_9BACT
MNETINNNKDWQNLPSGDTADMKTLASCVTKLDSLGYTTQFKAGEGFLQSLSTEKQFRPEEVHIVNFYRFEGASSPEDNAILYAIRTKDGEMGTLTDAYGAYSDTELTTFIQEVEKIQKKVDPETPMGDL